MVAVKHSNQRDIDDMIQQVAGSFDTFCTRFAHILDKKKRREIRFKRYPCQKRVSDRLLAGSWLCILKARQLGITWTLAVYVCWCMITKANFECCVLQQNRDYAKDFLRRVKYVYRHLPKWLQVPIATDGRYELTFRHPSGDAILRVLAGNDAAGRSLTANLVIFDEHAYIVEAKDSREGIESSLERSDGQIVCLSTSSGPWGDFFDVFMDGPNNGYEPMFLSWRELPDRTEEWYQALCERMKGNPTRRKREYPCTIAEAFLWAEGRIYPGLDPERNVCTFEQLGFHRHDAELYRGVDFGHVAPFACLWVANFPAEPPGLTIDPSCTNTLRELIGYHFDPKHAGKDRPAKIDDHTCFPAGTKVETLDDPELSIDLVRRGMWARSHLGWAMVEVGATATGNVRCVRVVLESGRTIVCTPDHPFALANGGFCRADGLKGHDVLVRADDDWRANCRAKRKKASPEVKPNAKHCVCPADAWSMKPSPAELRKMPVVGYRREKVIDVQETDDVVRVYSIATEHGTHTANGALVSNCDALRYIVLHFGLEGHVHIYREFYVEDSIGQGRTDMHDIEDIHSLSGWVLSDAHEASRFKPGPDAETYVGSVADRSLGKSIELYNQNDIDLDAYVGPDGEPSRFDVENGIRRLNVLIDGTREIRKEVVLTDEMKREREIELAQRGANHVGPSATLQEAALREVARQNVERRRRRRAQHFGYARQYQPFGRPT